MSGRDAVALSLSWGKQRPRVLVVACSDGRLQLATDEFLSRQFRITDYDRLYLPGGGGALCPSGRDFMRAHQMQQECRLLIDAHGVERVIVLFHGPAADGPPEATCADYRRKMSWALPDQVRARQEQDSRELLEERWQWSGTARVSVFRCEVLGTGGLQFVPLHDDAD
jgi:carbonic anhydrase-like protein